MLIGAIADDLTGATDLALTLARGGMRTLQVIGARDDVDTLSGYDAVVVALKSRTIDPVEAVAQSLMAEDLLARAGYYQLIFKYCSTFDSTETGNIGPVIEALATRCGAPLAIVCPAFPTNGRTVYNGYLFVDHMLLNESPMKDHPLTPMRDANLVRLLQAQTAMAVGRITHNTVATGPAALREAFATAVEQKKKIVVVDAINDDDLKTIGAAASDFKLITGASGIALGLPDNFHFAGLLDLSPPPASLSAPAGRAAILAGSCSAATREQVKAAAASGMPTLKVDPIAVAKGLVDADGIHAWAQAQPDSQPILIYSSDDPATVGAVHERLGRAESGALIESLLADAAQRLVASGFRRIIVAGGETSGAVVAALDIAALEIGPEIDPGVPWTRTSDGQLALALKSGNFGTPDFFVKAWSRLT